MRRASLAISPGLEEVDEAAVSAGARVVNGALTALLLAAPAASAKQSADAGGDMILGWVLIGRLAAIGAFAPFT